MPDTIATHRMQTSKNLSALFFMILWAKLADRIGESSDFSHHGNNSM